MLQSRYAEVRPLRIPTIVGIGTHILPKSVCQIVCANQEIGRLGAKALIGLGLKHFVYCGLAGLEFSDQRAIGFQQELRESGHSALLYHSPTKHLEQSWYMEQKQIARWLGALPKPVCLLACNDESKKFLASSALLRKNS